MVKDRAGEALGVSCGGGDRLVSVALLGAGRIGRVHLDCFSKLPFANVVALYDICHEAAVAACRQVGGSLSSDVVVTSVEDVFLRRPDLVVVCTPTTAHFEDVLLSLEHDAHVLCEKPLASTLFEMRTLSELAKAKGKSLYVGLNRRFDTNFQRLRDVIQDPASGAIFQYAIHSRDPQPPPEDYLKSSGGIMFDMGIHDMDMARYLCASDIASVVATGRKRNLSKAVDDMDVAVALLEHKNEALGTLQLSRWCAGTYDQRAEVVLENRVARVDNVPTHNVTVITPSNSVQAPPFMPFFTDRYAEAYMAQDKAVLELIARPTAAVNWPRETMPASGEDAIAATMASMAAARSAALCGVRVSLTLRWCIVGTGTIARSFADALTATPHCKLSAVVSRSTSKGKAFVDQLQGVAACDVSVLDRQEMAEAVGSSFVPDVVYVAVPHSLHAKTALPFLKAGIPVLCEKPFDTDLCAVEAMIEAAEKREVFLMDAIWSRFFPVYQEMKRLLTAGKIGEVVGVEAHFQFDAGQRLQDPSNRLLDVGLGGGGFWDVGLYVVQVIDDIFCTVTSSASGIERLSLDVLEAHKGVDLHGQISVPADALPRGLQSAGGSYAINLQGDNYLRVRGSGGVLEASPLHAPTRLSLNGKVVLSSSIGEPQGLKYEIQHVHDCLMAARKQSPVIPLQTSKRIIQVMQQAFLQRVHRNPAQECNGVNWYVSNKTITTASANVRQDL